MPAAIPVIDEPLDDGEDREVGGWIGGWVGGAVGGSVQVMSSDMVPISIPLQPV